MFNRMALFKLIAGGDPRCCYPNTSASSTDDVVMARRYGGKFASCQIFARLGNCVEKMCVKVVTENSKLRKYKY